MALSSDLISQFAKITNDDSSTKKESSTYGTIVTRNGTKYVQLDGSTLLTPIATTTTIDDDEKVSVTIKNHQATVMGNVTNPSVRATELDETNTNITKVEKTVSENDEAYQLQFTSINGSITTLTANGESLSSQISDVSGNVSKLEQTATDLTSQISSANGDISTLKQTATDLTSQISSVNGDVSTLKQTATDLTSQISSANSDISTLKQTAESLETSVSNINGDISDIKLDATSITSRVENVEGKYTEIKQTVDGINLTGYVTFDNLETSGETTINGDNITTGSIQSPSGTVGIKGYLKITQAGSLRDSLGTIGYFAGSADGSTSDTEGIAICNALAGSDSSGLEYQKGIYVSNVGVSMQCKAITDGSDVTYTGNNYTQSMYCVPAGPTISARHGSLSTNLYEIRLYAGCFGPTVASVGRIACGNSVNYWEVGYSASGWKTTSDRNRKNSISYDIEDKYDALFDALKPCYFKYNDGTSGRYHTGFVAQDIEESLEDAGLTSQDFAGFVKGLDADGNDIYFLGYEEFIALNTMKIKQQEKKIEDLENRLAALEAKLAADA